MNAEIRCNEHGMILCKYFGTEEFSEGGKSTYPDLDRVPGVDRGGAELERRRAGALAGGARRRGSPAARRGLGRGGGGRGPWPAVYGGGRRWRGHQRRGRAAPRRRRLRALALGPDLPGAGRIWAPTGPDEVGAVGGDVAARERLGWQGG